MCVCVCVCMCIKQINKESLAMQLSFLLSQQVYWFLSKKKIWLQTPIHLEPGHFYSFTFVLPTINRWAGRKFFININWIPPCAKHHVTLLEHREEGPSQAIRKQVAQDRLGTQDQWQRLWMQTLYTLLSPSCVSNPYHCLSLTIT